MAHQSMILKSTKDSDGDGVPDYIEERDGTSINDPYDYKDTDGDGVPDYIEERDGTSINEPKEYKDTDGDGAFQIISKKETVHQSMILMITRTQMVMAFQII
jgi:hypothetical protein